MAGAMREIESPKELLAALAGAEASSRSMGGWQVQGLDLTGVESRLLGLDAEGALFLGCKLSAETADRLRAGGALLFPMVPDVPFDPWRPHLYTPVELYAGLEKGYAATLDARIYGWYLAARGTGLMRNLLAESLHDSSIDDALQEYAEGRRVVGVMGGHAVARTDPRFLATARLAHQLGRQGLTVATGGGPGAMEAANLGARLAGEDPAVLVGVVEHLSAVPSFRPDVTAWARVALEAVQDLADADCSLGIPTWHYGHEPPNVFSARVAKYFRNAIREDVLLQVCRDGIVFLPGAAGTVQEVFQSACANFYAAEGRAVPMVFVGMEHWTRVLPAWQLVSALFSRLLPPGAAVTGGALQPLLHLVDDPAEVPALLLQER